MPMTQEQQEVFLKQPEVAVISTIDEFGRPRSAPIWFLWEDGAAYMFTARRTLKWRNLQSRPYASLCVDKRDAPYSSVVMDGPVQETDRPLYELVLSMALRYYGEKKGRSFAEGYRDAPGVVAFKLSPRHIASYTPDDA